MRKIKMLFANLSMLFFLLLGISKNQEIPCLELPDSYCVYVSNHSINGNTILCKFKNLVKSSAIDSNSANWSILDTDTLVLTIIKSKEKESFDIKYIWNYNSSDRYLNLYILFNPECKITYMESVIDEGVKYNKFLISAPKCSSIFAYVKEGKKIPDYFTNLNGTAKTFWYKFTDRVDIDKFNIPSNVKKILNLNIQ